MKQQTPCALDNCCYAILQHQLGNVVWLLSVRYLLMNSNMSMCVLRNKWLIMTTVSTGGRVAICMQVQRLEP
jgi:hypothetical protein